MKFTNIWLIVFCFLFGCSQPKDKRNIFNAEDQKPITSLISKKQNTVSILFGNSPAVRSTTKGIDLQGGEIFTLVTWHQQGNKYWYPGLINGSVKSIEVLDIKDVNGELTTNYHLKEGEAPVSYDNKQYSIKERISYIRNLKPAVYP
ncbi:hypothetical protein [Pedobacter sp. Leaf194]|uniref:hypothetical protein n=1 Tax=Pedobacter sp. Leaf194 TaxID=1736297 RepID=UPI0007030AFB|nr:hypothetical protein [Pedobacter sp. Leaf194]KQS36231.1 hypothetical protein ASG14_12450 [Pedobacter sp. Leaf194]